MINRVQNPPAFNTAPGCPTLTDAKARKPSLVRLKRLKSFGTTIAALALTIAGPLSAMSASAVFGGGPFYSGGTSVMNTLRSSGFTTVILWSIHVHSNGDLVLNDQLVVSNGSYVGNSSWPGQLATLKQAPTSVTRIEVSIGSAGVNDFHTIQSLIASQGTGTGSILYRNFQALKSATGANAADFDDEDLFNASTSVSFGNMLSAIGYKITLCPYNNSAYWQSVKSQLGTKVDKVYLQCYAGGAGNNPGSWSSTLGITVDPGLWCRHGSGCTAGDNPSSVQTKMTNWKTANGITGGFMWLYDDMQACSSQGSPAQYASAINTAVGGTTTGVKFYQNINYGGTVTSAIPKGNYTLSQLQGFGFVNDWASSARIPSGWTVILYQHDNFGGTSWTLSGDTPNFTSFTGLNDQASSCKIQ